MLLLLFSVSIGGVLLNSIYFDRIIFFGSMLGGVFIRFIFCIFWIWLLFCLFFSLSISVSLCVCCFFLNCIFFFIFPFVYCLFCCIHISVFMQMVILNVIKLLYFCLAFGSWLTSCWCMVYLPMLSLIFASFVLCVEFYFYFISIWFLFHVGHLIFNSSSVLIFTTENYDKLNLFWKLVMDCISFICRF